MTRPTFVTGYALEPNDSLFPNLWDGLVGAWCPSMGKQGSTLFDFSPYKNHGSLTNMDAATDYVPGKFGTALNYDGSDDNLDIGHILQIDDASQDLTFAFWMRTSTGQSNNAFITYDTNDALSPGTDIYCMFKSNVTIGGFGDGGEWNTGYASSNLHDGEWHHVIILLRGTTKYVYDNAQLVASVGTAHNHANYGLTHNFRVADNSNVGHYAGDIEDFFLYNRALRPEEISLLYNGGSPLTPVFAPSPFFVSPDQTVSPDIINLSSSVLAPTIVIDTTVTPSALDVVTSVETPVAGVVLTVLPSAIDSLSEVLSPDIVIDNTFTPSVIDVVTSVLAPSIPQDAPFPSKIISFNPLVIVTNSDPAKIVEIDISDPENPTASVTTLTSAKNAKDVARNSETGFLYVACADGIVVKVDETDFATQTIIDLSDTDDLQTMEVFSAFNLAYTSTDNIVGELYLIDERTTSLGDFRLDVISEQSVFGDMQFDLYQQKSMDSDCQILAETTGKLNTDFKCLTDVVDDITPINQTDFDVKLDAVSLDSVDLLLESIVITHTVAEKSTAQFTLSRKHDQLDIDLDGNTRQITNQNAVIITIQGRTEFTGKVSQIDSTYSNNEEIVVVTATGDEKTNQYNNVILSLPSLDERLSLYNVLLQNPVIHNPFIDPTDENPLKYKGITVDLGDKRQQSFSRYTFFDSSGSIANRIQAGTFVARQNWTYFWTPTVKKFGNVALGQTSSVTFLYIGTSLSPITEDLWQLNNAKHRRQRQYDDIVTSLGTYTVGSAPFKEIKSRNGIFEPKFHWTDGDDALYSIKEAGYNFELFAKTVADLEYQKLLNINGDILPDTSASMTLTIDGYYFYNLSLLTRINVDNTTQTGIYKNSNGFPISIKSISINSSSLKAVLTADNSKSTSELEQIDGQFPDEDDDEYNTPAKTISIAGKSSMKSRLAVS